MLYSLQGLSKELELLKELFFDLLNKLEIYENDNALDSLSEQLTKKVEEWLIMRDSQDLEDFAPKEKVELLERMLEEYSDLLGYGDTKDPKELIIDTFTFKKYLSGIERQTNSKMRIESFITSLSEFFFVEYTGYEIFISRFRNLPEFAKMNYMYLSDADTAGTVYGYSPKDIVLHCKEKGLLELIKF